MKKITALLLFFVMILCSSGLYISYQLSLYSIRQQQKKMILHSNSVEHRLVVFSFPLNYSQNKNVDLLFVEDDEIMFNGKMYDIVHQYKSADSIFIKCISDEIEDDVREEASNQINKTKGNTAQKNFSAFKFNPGPFTTGSETYEFYYIVNCFCATFLFLKDFKPVACYLNVPSPPPWNNV